MVKLSVNGNVLLLVRNTIGQRLGMAPARHFTIESICEGFVGFFIKENSYYWIVSQAFEAPR